MGDVLLINSKNRCIRLALLKFELTNQLYCPDVTQILISDWLDPNIEGDASLIFDFWLIVVVVVVVVVVDMCGFITLHSVFFLSEHSDILQFSFYSQRS